MEAWFVPCSSTSHPCRYEELKLLAGGLEAEADDMASEADKAYQGSLVLLNSLSRLMKTDVGSFEVRALCLWDQESPLSLSPTLPASSSALPRALSPRGSHQRCIFPPFCPHRWPWHKEQETTIHGCLLWFLGR